MEISGASWRSHPVSIKLLFVIYALCFLIATFNHARDLWHGGFLPYRHAPLGFNVYWTSLTLLDPLTVVLLCWLPRGGIVLAVLIMVSDVAVNSYAAYLLQDSYLFYSAALQLQSVFLGFVVGTAPFAWARVGRIERAA